MHACLSPCCVYSFKSALKSISHNCTNNESLMKKCGDSRTGFQPAKHLQLKFHIGHKRYLQALQNSKSTKGSVSRSHCKLHSNIHMFINDLIRITISLVNY